MPRPAVFHARAPEPLTYAESLARFRSWLKTFAPDVFEAVASKTTALSGIAEVTADGDSSIWGRIGDAISSMALYDQQRKLFELQLERAKAGLPPIPVDQYGVPVSVGIDPATRNLIMYVGIGIGALFLLSQLSKR